MAQAIACDLCGQEPAAIMQTNLTNGDAIAVGDSCMLVFLVTVVQTMIAEMPADTVSEYAAMLKPVIDALQNTRSYADVLAVMDENPVTGDIEPYQPATGDSADV